MSMNTLKVVIIGGWKGYLKEKTTGFNTVMCVLII